MITEKECLAVVWGIEYFQIYLDGRKTFEVYTDHTALQTLMSVKDLDRKRARWMIKLARFKFTIHYHSEKANKLADYMSRAINCITCGYMRDPNNWEAHPTNQYQCEAVMLAD